MIDASAAEVEMTADDFRRIALSFDGAEESEGA
jgi:hypothetical protein